MLTSPSTCCDSSRVPISSSLGFASAARFSRRPLAALAGTRSHSLPLVLALTTKSSR